MRAFVTIECFILAALTAMGVFAALLLSFVIRLDTDQLQVAALMISYVQVANGFFFLAGAYFTTWLVHRMTTNAHFFAPNQITRPVDDIGGRFSLMFSVIQSPIALRRLWRQTFGMGPIAEKRGGLIVWCWRIGLAGVVAATAASVLRAFDPFGGNLVASGLSTLSYALGAACGTLLIRIFGMLAKAQQLLIQRAAAAR